MANKTSLIHPSPAIITRADTPIRECVRMMQKRNVGSILVVSDNASQQLIGIFTERDLLRTVELIDTGNYWDKPIRTVMSTPVKVLPVNKLHKAGEIMLKHGFRHLPIVSNDDKNVFRVLGVISMRDLFANLVRDIQTAAAAEREAATGSVDLKKFRPFKVSVVSPDQDFSALIARTLSTSQVSVDSKLLGHIRSPQDKSDLVVMDIDQIRSADWLAALKEINLHEDPPFVVVAFSPSMFTSKTIETLEKLTSSKRFEAYAKPIAMNHLIELVREQYQKRR